MKFILASILVVMALMPLIQESQAGFTEDCMAKCPAPAIYRPVCGTNKQTYSNEGILNCANKCNTNRIAIGKKHNGPCE